MARRAALRAEEEARREARRARVAQLRAERLEADAVEAEDDGRGKGVHADWLTSIQHFLRMAGHFHFAPFVGDVAFLSNTKVLRSMPSDSLP